MIRVCSACKGKKLHPEDKGVIVLTECDKSPLCQWCFSLHVGPIDGCEFCRTSMASGGFIVFSSDGTLSKSAWKIRETYLVAEIKEALANKNLCNMSKLDLVTDIIMRRAENIRDYQ